MQNVSMQIVSIQVGKPQTHYSPDPNAAAHAHSRGDEASDSGWVSGIFKSAVAGPRFLGVTNLEDDSQADLKVHGGPDKAVCVYAYEHYAHWQRQFDLVELPMGAFGENFTTTGLLESELCIGDSFAVGDGVVAEGGKGVVVQLSQPRQPCWKLARRWQIGDLAVQVQDTGYTGWYFRVLQEGIVQPGECLRLIERPYPGLTLDEANRVMHHDKEDWEAIIELMQCPLLSVSWRNGLRRRVNLHGPKG